MRKKAYLVHTHRYGYRAGEPAEIMGVQIVTPGGCPPRVCFCLRFDDGNEDVTPISDTQNFKIISEDDVATGNVPKVSH